MFKCMLAHLLIISMLICAPGSFAAVTMSDEDLIDPQLSSLCEDPENDAWKAEVEAADASIKQENYQEAEKHFTNALKEAEKFGANDFRVAYCLVRLAGVYLGTKKYPECNRDIERATAIYKKLTNDDSKIFQSLRFMQVTMQALQGDPKEADAKINSFMRTVQLKQMVPFRDAVVDAMMTEAEGLEKKYGTSARTHLAKLVDEEWEDSFRSIRDLEKAEKLEEAMTAYKKLRRDAEAKKNSSNLYTVKMINDLHVIACDFKIGLLYGSQRKYKQALDMLLPLPKKMDTIVKPDSPLIIECCRVVACLEVKLGRNAEAKALYERVVAAEDTHPNKYDIPGYGDSLDHAYLFLLAGKYADAETQFKEISSDQTALAKIPSDYVDCKEGLARTYIAQKKYKEAKPILQNLLDNYKSWSRPADDIDLKRCNDLMAAVDENLNR